MRMLHSALSSQLATPRGVLLDNVPDVLLLSLNLLR